MGCIPSSELDARRNNGGKGKRRSKSRSTGRRASRRPTNPATAQRSSHSQNAAPPTDHDGNESQPQRVLQENEQQQQPTVAAPTRSSESREDVASVDGVAVGSSPARTDGAESHHPPLADHPPEQPVSPPRASSLASATEMNTRRGSAARPLLPPVVTGGRSVAATTSGRRSNSASGSANQNQPPTDPMVGGGNSNSRPTTDGGENSRHSFSLKSTASEDRRRGSRSSQTGGGVVSSPNPLRRSNSVTAAVNFMGSRPAPEAISILRDSHSHSHSRSMVRDPRIEQWLEEMIEETFVDDFSGPDENMSEAYRPEPIPDLPIDQGCSPDCYCNETERRSQSIHQRARSELLVNPLAGFR